jgi:hypothetical protein
MLHDAEPASAPVISQIGSRECFPARMSIIDNRQLQAPGFMIS